MLYERGVKLGVLWYIVLLCGVMGLASTTAQAQLATGKAKTDRLVMGLITPYLDYVRPWIAGTADHNIVHDPVFEWLIEVDAETGQFKPWLATSWEMAQDGRSWRVKLQEGVPVPSWLWGVYGQRRGAYSCPVV